MARKPGSMEDKLSEVEFMKFDLYIDAVGDGAARSRGIIALLMTATLVAGLGMFNSLRKEHNWFGSRIDALHQAYPWVVFPEDEMKSDSIPIKVAKAILPTHLQQDSLIFNQFTWGEFKWILNEGKVPFDTMEIKMPVHIKYKFPSHCTTGDSLNLEVLRTAQDSGGMFKILSTIQRMNFTSRDELDNLVSIYDRARIENSTLIRMPVVGITFDVNWLNFVSSLSFSIILFLLYYNLSRERKNLFLVFRVAELKNIDRLDFYQMLSMRQVLHIPASVDEFVYPDSSASQEAKWEAFVRKMSNRMAKLPLYAPAVVWILILIHDISTFNIGKSINSDLTYIGFIASIICGVFMLFFVGLCWQQWEKIIYIWKQEAKKIERDYSNTLTTIPNTTQESGI
jgi:hypothetical protein